MDSLARPGLKVWSLVMTILGDMAPGDGTSVPGPTLSAITARFDIRPETLRVALHRLRRDGWAETERTGRTSQHALSERGRAETLAARHAVYGTGEAEGDWRLATLPEPAALPFQIAPRAHLVAPDVPDPEGALMAYPVLPLDPWAAGEILAPGVRAAYEALAARLEGAPPSGLDRVDRLALRISVLHDWRRLALREPPSAADLFGADWIGAQVRARVHAWLEAL